MIRLDLQIVANAALGLDLDNGIDRAQLAPQEGQVYLNIVIARLGIAAPDLLP